MPRLIWVFAGCTDHFVGFIMFWLNYMWASSWENLFMLYANNKGADQPAHPRSLISAVVVCCLDSIIPLVSISEMSSLYLASVAVQVGLCLTWWQTPKTGFLVRRLMYFVDQANLVLIAYASSEGSGEPVHPRSLARTSAACSYKQ